MKQSYQALKLLAFLYLTADFGLCGNLAKRNEDEREEKNSRTTFK